MSKFWTIGSEQWFPTWEAARAAQVAFAQDGYLVEIEEWTTEEAYGDASRFDGQIALAEQRNALIDFCG